MDCSDAYYKVVGMKELIERLESLTEAKLTPDQSKEVQGELVKKGVPVRFLIGGQAIDIVSGKAASKGSNIMYHPVYWNFTKETAKKIAKWLGAKAVFSD